MKDSGLMTDSEKLPRGAHDLEGRSAVELLQLAVEQYAPRLTFATGFGPEGCVIIDLIGRHRLPIDVFTLDTGLLFPETYELWRRLEEWSGVQIRAVQPSLSVGDQAAVHGDQLWEKLPEQCCEMRKVVPLKAELKNCLLYTSPSPRD